MTWVKCGGLRFTHYITHVAHIDKTIFFVEQRNRTHQYMLEPPSWCLLFEPLIPCDLAHMHFDVRRGGIGAQVTRVVDYVHFVINKFESPSITL